MTEEDSEKNMAHLKSKIQNDPDSIFMMNFLFGVGNHERIQILEEVKNEPLNVSDLSHRINKSQSTISHHLKILETNGLIKGVKSGKFTQYSLDKVNFDRFNRLFAKFVE